MNWTVELLPYKNVEKRRQYDREYKRRKRAEKRKEAEERREKEIDAHFRAGDLNFGIKTQKPKFMTYLEWKNHNPDGEFKQYLREKREFDFENRDYGEPLKIPNRLSESEKEFAFGVGLNESEHCQKLKEALRNATNPIQIMLIKGLLEEDCS